MLFVLISFQIEVCWCSKQVLLMVYLQRELFYWEVLLEKFLFVFLNDVMIIFHFDTVLFMQRNRHRKSLRSSGRCADPTAAIPLSSRRESVLLHSRPEQQEARKQAASHHDFRLAVSASSQLRRPRQQVSRPSAARSHHCEVCDPEANRPSNFLFAA